MPGTSDEAEAMFDEAPLTPMGRALVCGFLALVALTRLASALPGDDSSDPDAGPPSASARPSPPSDRA